MLFIEINPIFNSGYHSESSAYATYHCDELTICIKKQFKQENLNIGPPLATRDMRIIKSINKNIEETLHDFIRI